MSQKTDLSPLSTGLVVENGIFVKKTLKFKAATCSHCGQTTEVLYSLDQGTADIVKAIAVRIKLKGINVVHLRKEMEVVQRDFSYARMHSEGVLTPSMIGNVTRARKHGLIAFCKDKKQRNAGNYCLTTKGAKFLRGEPVPKYALQDKTTGHIKGYYRPEEYTVTIHDLRSSDAPYWESIGFNIEQGHIVYDLPKKQDTLKLAI